MNNPSKKYMERSAEDWQRLLEGSLQKEDITAPHTAKMADMSSKHDAAMLRLMRNIDDSVRRTPQITFSRDFETQIMERVLEEPQSLWARLKHSFQHSFALWLFGGVLCILAVFALFSLPINTPQQSEQISIVTRSASATAEHIRNLNKTSATMFVSILRGKAMVPFWFVLTAALFVLLERVFKRRRVMLPHG